MFYQQYPRFGFDKDLPPKKQATGHYLNQSLLVFTNTYAPFVFKDLTVSIRMSKHLKIDIALLKEHSLPSKNQWHLNAKVGLNMCRPSLAIGLRNLVYKNWVMTYPLFFIFQKVIKTTVNGYMVQRLFSENDQAIVWLKRVQNIHLR